jgi:hypothetical protein
MDCDVKTPDIPERCMRVYNVLSGRKGICPRADGRWSTDAIVELTSHHNDGKKARELAVERPDVVERDYLDRADGEIKPTLEECSKPIALYRLSAKYDPRRAHERAAAMQLTLFL